MMHVPGQDTKLLFLHPSRNVNTRELGLLEMLHLDNDLASYSFILKPTSSQIKAGHTGPKKKSKSKQKTQNTKVSKGQI